MAIVSHDWTSALVRPLPGEKNLSGGVLAWRATFKRKRANARVERVRDCQNLGNFGERLAGVHHMRLRPSVGPNRRLPEGAIAFLLMWWSCRAVPTLAILSKREIVTIGKPPKADRPLAANPGLEANVRFQRGAARKRTVRDPPKTALSVHQRGVRFGGVVPLGQTAIMGAKQTPPWQPPETGFDPEQSSHREQQPQRKRPTSDKLGGPPGPCQRPIVGEGLRCETLSSCAVHLNPGIRS